MGQGWSSRVPARVSWGVCVFLNMKYGLCPHPVGDCIFKAVPYLPAVLGLAEL